MIHDLTPRSKRRTSCWGWRTFSISIEDLKFIIIISIWPNSRRLKRFFKSYKADWIISNQPGKDFCIFEYLKYNKKHTHKQTMKIFNVSSIGKSRENGYNHFGDFKMVTFFTFRWQSRSVGIILITFYAIGDIFNVVNRSSTRFVSDIRHQHRCSLENLFISIIMGTYRNWVHRQTEWDSVWDGWNWRKFIPLFVSRWLYFLTIYD